MLSEINVITKTELNARMKNIADNVKRQVMNAKAFRDFYQTLTDADLVEIGYGETSRQFIGAFSVALLNLYEAYENTAKTGSSDPSYVIEQFASPTPW
jgi:hypothetical protein